MVLVKLQYRSSLPYMSTRSFGFHIPIFQIEKLCLQISRFVQDNAKFKFLLRNPAVGCSLHNTIKLHIRMINMKKELLFHVPFFLKKYMRRSGTNSGLELGTVLLKGLFCQFKWPFRDCFVSSSDPSFKVGNAPFMTRNSLDIPHVRTDEITI